MPLTLGYKASAEQFGPRELLDYSVLAEQLGLDSVAVSDHFQPWRHHGGHSPNSLVWLGALAERTERAQLGTSVLTPTMRYHPSIVAQAAATLACLAPGRTYLAVGTGEALNEYSSIGDWPGYVERQARLAEAIALIRALWTGDEVTFDGDFFRTRKARLYTRPEAAIPLYVSSLSPGSAAFAGKHGDGLLTVVGNRRECTSGS